MSDSVSSLSSPDSDSGYWKPVTLHRALLIDCECPYCGADYSEDVPLSYRCTSDECPALEGPPKEKVFEIPATITVEIVARVRGFNSTHAASRLSDLLNGHNMVSNRNSAGNLIPDLDYDVTSACLSAHEDPVPTAGEER